MKKLSLDKIRFDGQTQMREELHGDTLRDYTDAMKAGDEFPPITVFFDGADYWIGDGYHRWHAAGDAGLTEIDCDIRQGSKRQAILFACSANGSHGLRRTNADKRKAVVAMLSDDEWRTWSDRQIADHCGVGNQLVGDVRRQVCDSHTCESRQSKRRTGADGKSYPAVPQHTKPTPKEVDEPKPTTAKQPAPVDDDPEQADGDCPKGGDHEPKQDGDESFCAKCLEPLEAAPAQAKPVKVKSTVVAQCQALWDALTPTERIFAAGWFQDQLG